MEIFHKAAVYRITGEAFSDCGAYFQEDDLRQLKLPLFSYVAVLSVQRKSGKAVPLVSDAPPVVAAPSVPTYGGWPWSYCRATLVHNSRRPPRGAPFAPECPNSGHARINLEGCLSVARLSWFCRWDEIIIEVHIKGRTQHVIGWATEPCAACFKELDLMRAGIHLDEAVPISILATNGRAVNKLSPRTTCPKE
jgi:hypothetical protein